MSADLRLVPLSFTADTLHAMIPAIASVSTRKVLKPKPQTCCAEFAVYAEIRLSRLEKYDSPIDNRELAFTITVETAMALAEAMDNFLGVQVWGKQERHCNDAKLYLEHKVSEMPETAEAIEVEGLARSDLN